MIPLALRQASLTHPEALCVCQLLVIYLSLSVTYIVLKGRATASIQHAATTSAAVTSGVTVTSQRRNIVMN
eukprot:6188180-Pleurochrysis_carterae.AAC.3